MEIPVRVISFSFINGLKEFFEILIQRDCAMIIIGKVLKPQGIKGEIKVLPITPDIQRFELLDEIFLSKNIDEGEGYAIEEVKYLLAKNIVILKLADINNCEQAEKFKDYNILISEEQQLELEEDQYYIHDLIGLTVVTTSGDKIGVVKNVLDTPANNVFEIEGNNGEELLVPFIYDADCTVDMEKRTLTVNPDYVVS
jgi:16S rRNA processing protein RimM